MTLPVLLFIATIFIGIYLYWSESKNNAIFRFFNKVANDESIQMSRSDKKGFLYQRDFLYRLVIIGFAYILFYLLSLLIFPFSIMGVQIYTSSVVGTVIGTYIASAFLVTKEVVGDRAESIEDAIEGTLERGRDFIETIGSGSKESIPPVEDIEAIDVTPKKEESSEKSARERLKDKGLL